VANSKSSGSSLWRLIITNGIPNHCSTVFTGTVATGLMQAGQSYNWNGNYPCEHFQSMLVPMSPTKNSTFTYWGMGAIGISVSGGLIYNYASADSPCNGAVYSEDWSMDQCNGHADANGNYHYHGAPNCVYGYNTCQLMGWMMDGYPIYGQCSIIYTGTTTTIALTSNYALTSGCTTTNTTYVCGCATTGTYGYTYSASNGGTLDAANGYTFTAAATSADGKVSFASGTYAYFFSSGFPYTTAGYYGTVTRPMCAFTTANLKSQITSG